jgi:hypothetical protein
MHTRRSSWGHIALRRGTNGHAFVTKQLIEGRCTIYVQEKNGITPLYPAAHPENAVVTKQLIEARCNVDLQTKVVRRITAHYGHAAVMKQLIEARCNINLHSRSICITLPSTSRPITLCSVSARGARRNRHADTVHKVKRC